MNARFAISYLALAAMLGACTTTTSADECAKAGVFCNPTPVRAKTAEMQSQAEADLANINAINAKYEERHQIELSLAAQRDALVTALNKQQEANAALQADLDAALRKNKVSKAEYARLSGELTEIKNRISNYVNAPARSLASRSDLDGANNFLKGRVAEVQEHVHRATLG